MSLHSNSISSKYIVSICNSDFVSRYTESFVNSTVIFQINDARQIPIIIPDSETLETFEKLFNSAIEIKKSNIIRDNIIKRNRKETLRNTRKIRYNSK